MLCFQSVLYCIVLYNDVFTFLYVAVGNKPTTTTTTTTSMSVLSSMLVISESKSRRFVSMGGCIGVEYATFPVQSWIDQRHLPHVCHLGE